MKKLNSFGFTLTHLNYFEIAFWRLIIISLEMSSITLSDKSQKKSKAFLDGSSKLKHRHTALLSFVESATEPEQLLVFKENIDYIVGFIIESVKLMFEKLDGKTI